MIRHTFRVHNFPMPTLPALSLASRTETAPPRVRPARLTDVKQMWELVGTYAAQGAMLPRTTTDIAGRIENYVVAVDESGHVLACAALEEYSPSLGEVASVAVVPSEHGKGLGTAVVLSIERLARARDIEELFALSLTDNFFLSMGYEPTTVSRYPEKLARYDSMKSAGIDIVPKPCFNKRLDEAWPAPQLMPEAELQRMAG